MDGATMYSQADIARALMEAGALPPGNYERVFSRVRSWYRRGKLPDPAGQRPDGRPLWNEADVSRLIDTLAKGG